MWVNVRIFHHNIICEEGLPDWTNRRCLPQVDKGRVVDMQNALLEVFEKVWPLLLIKHYKRRPLALLKEGHLHCFKALQKYGNSA